VGFDSPLGSYFRRFWLPICSADDLPVGAERPVRAQLLDERLVGFRDGQGHIGLIYGLCPHARGDMFFSAIEEDGIRCNYHGWKFDVHGVCLETPMHPDGSGIDTLAFPVAEHAGLIWGYLGDDDPPALPDIPIAAALNAERRARPWLETIVGELLAGTAPNATAQVSDGSLRLASDGVNSATFTPPFLITHGENSQITIVLPSSDRATALLGGQSDGTEAESEAAPAIRQALDELLRQIVAG
jgi:nitrite reductase/ring-hydroxylating ferredoxin subunit